MFDFRKVLVILIIAVLYAAFVFSFVYAVYPSPEYDDYCDERARPLYPEKDCPLNEDLQAQQNSCYETDGEPIVTYGVDGCPASVTCSTCRQDYDAARENYNIIFFIISAVLGAVSIIVALLLPSAGQVNQWIGSGLLLGGVIVIFGGTIVTFGNLYTWLRPIVMLAELLLVIFLAYRLWDRAEKPSKKS